MTERRHKAAVVLTAAGSSSRMGTGRKKEFLHIANRTVLETSLIPFLDSQLFSSFVIVLPPDKINDGKKILSVLPGSENFILAPGGITRQESVFNGLQILKGIGPEYVLIHDGARPWISKEIIERVFNETVRSGAAIPVVPSINAMKRTDKGGWIIEHLERNSTVAAQTPQGFIYQGILEAHGKAANDMCTYIDDSEIFQKYSGRVATVSGEPQNRKITYQSDIKEK